MARPEADTVVQAIDFIGYFLAQNVSVLSYSRIDAACDTVRRGFSTKLSTFFAAFSQAFCRPIIGELKNADTGSHSPCAPAVVRAAARLISAKKNGPYRARFIATCAH